jgi:hypoxanthine phosphoribosyltransferase
VSDRLEVLLPAEAIAEKVRELGRRIASDYHGRNLLLVGVLKGCFLFLADLVRHLPSPVRIEFLRVASYGQATETSGVVQIRMDLDASVADWDVLIVEDVLDTGLTLDYLKRHLATGNPKSLRVCTLLDKKGRRRVVCEADYVGFVIDDHFVVGYGLDFDERYRELPSICILHRDGDG